MNPSTSFTPSTIGMMPNNAEASITQPSTPHVNRIYIGLSEDYQSFGVIDELSSNSKRAWVLMKINILGMIFGCAIHKTCNKG